MKKIVFLFLIIIGFHSNAQTKKPVYKSGEWLKYRMHYGLVNAGYATIEIKDTIHKSKEAYHVTGNGWTSGFISLFFNVEDNYETSFYKET